MYFFHMELQVVAGEGQATDAFKPHPSFVLYLLLIAIDDLWNEICFNLIRYLMKIETQHKIYLLKKLYLFL